MDLSNLSPPEGATTEKTRVGRGEGSGHGKTCGKGHKGQKARQGSDPHPRFEGGQTPIYLRLPKYGFNNKNRDEAAIVNVGRLDAVFEDGDEVTPEELRDRGQLSGDYDYVKILGDGELETELNVQAHRFSDSALEKIEDAGGNAEVIERG